MFIGAYMIKDNDFFSWGMSFRKLKKLLFGSKRPNKSGEEGIVDD